MEKAEKQYAVRLKETKEVLFLLDTTTGNYLFSDQLEVIKGDEIECCRDENTGSLLVVE